MLCEPATTIHEELVGGINRAVKLARECDVVVLAVGEDMTMSGEAACRQEICVPAIQMELARAVAAAGKPVVAVVTCGRPLLLDWFDKNASAVLCAWFAGTEAGHALADLLAGDANVFLRLSHPCAKPRVTEKVTAVVTFLLVIQEISPSDIFEITTKAPCGTPDIHGRHGCKGIYASVLHTFVLVSLQTAAFLFERR